MAKSDYISRETAIKSFINDNQHLYYPFEVQSRIRNIPAADVVEVKHGEWEDVSVLCYQEIPVGTKVASMFCPVCERWHNEVYHIGNLTEIVHYCPHCGAKMDGGKNNGAKQ